LVVGLAKGVDPRKQGSGNIGATNVGRLLGGRYFALVFLLDLLKGLLPMAAAGWVIHARLTEEPGWTVYLLWLGVGFAAILGHLFSLFLKFKGGKGVATSAGVALGLFPYFTWAALIAGAVWVAVFLAKRYVSLASMVAVVVFAAAYAVIAELRGWHPFTRQLPLMLFALLVAALILLRHRANIARLLAGTEHRAGRSAKPGAVP
jgi:glycerol-3-phosphate acyltransferase PlsY